MTFKEKILLCLGRFPEKCKPNAEITETRDMGTHTLQTVRYDVEPGERITAYLLIPAGTKGRLPGIIACHQHGGEFWLGKSEPAGLSANAMYHFGLDMCLRGYAVLCPDHLCFEDRRPPEFIRKENDSLEGRNYERFEFTKRVFEGSTLQAKYISDLMRGVDALLELGCVYPDRIGAVGHSLGGQEALWLMWADGRIKAAAASCGFSQIRAILRDGINHNFALYGFGLLNYADVGDIVSDIAPRPFFMSNGAQDRIFPVDGVREIARMAKERYSAAGAPENFRSVVFEGGHSFPVEVKAEAYGFLDKFIKQ